MPQIFYDWQVWWLDFWVAHPYLYWGAICLGLFIVVLKRRRR
jgi:hypothetical protein